MNDIRDLPRRAVEKLEQFFCATNALENKELASLARSMPLFYLTTDDRYGDDRRWP